MGKIIATTVDDEMLMLEAATAVNMLRDGFDSDKRAETLKERVGVANERLVGFILPVPEGYDAKDVAVFSRFMVKAFEHLMPEAEEQVKFERTWNVMGEELA